MLDTARDAPLSQPAGIAARLSGLPSRSAFAGVFVLWAAVSLIAGMTAFLARGGQGFGDWTFVMQPMLRYYGVWFVCSLLIYQVARRYSGSPRKLMMGYGIHLLLLLTFTMTMPFVVSPNSWDNMLYGQRAPGFHSLSVIIYVYCLIGAYLLLRYRAAETLRSQAVAAELQAVSLENQLNLARIDALKMQINPHFLFNAFNSIAALIEARRNDDAYEALGLLGDLLRTAMTHASDRLVSVDDELAFVKRYIAVEQLRFGDRLELVVEVAPDCLVADVPALLLQPLVENAVKHAVSSSPERVSVTVSVQRSGDTLLLSVLDNGPGFAVDEAAEPGVGLANVRRRLQLLFPESAELRCENAADGGAHVTVSLPFCAAAFENATAFSSAS
ncbi:MAG: histidine kinase [Pseudomonadota bacterium]